MSVSYERGGKYKSKYKHTLAGGESLYLDKKASIEFLVENGMDEDDAGSLLDEAKNASKVPTRNYNYACKAPFGDEDRDMGGYVIAGHKTIVDYFFESNRYSNKAVEIERRFREEKQRILEELCPTYGRLKKQIAGLTDTINEKSTQVKKERQRVRARVCIESVEAEITELKKRRTSLKADCKVARQEEYAAYAETLKDAWSAIKKLADAEKKALYHDKAYRLIGQARTALASAKTKGRGGLPRFRRSTGEGSLTVQIGAGGINFTSLLSTDHTSGYIHVEPAASDDTVKVFDRKGRPYMRRPRALLYFRIGSVSRRKPIWAVLPITLHDRGELPGDLKIKQAKLMRERVGTQWKWRVVLTVESKSGFASRTVGTGRVAVDFGWRKVPGGIRVAYYKGNDGSHGELVLPDSLLRLPPKRMRGKRGERRYKASVVANLRHAEGLQSTRDKEFNEIHTVFCKWIEAATVPEWLATATEHVAQWKSPRRLSGLVYRWSKNRFDGDGEIFERLAAWRKQEEHLFNWERHEARSAQTKRLHLFRDFAATLRKTYGDVGIENIKLKDLHRRAAVEGEADVQSIRWNMRTAAIGILKNVLLNSGMAPRLLDPVDSSATCHECGYVNDFGEGQYQTCSECRKSWDRDFNAASVLLDRLCDALNRERLGLAASA